MWTIIYRTVRKRLVQRLNEVTRRFWQRKINFVKIMQDKMLNWWMCACVNGCRNGGRKKSSSKINRFLNLIRLKFPNSEKFSAFEKKFLWICFCIFIRMKNFFRFVDHLSSRDHLSLLLRWQPSFWQCTCDVDCKIFAQKIVSMLSKRDG